MGASEQATRQASGVPQSGGRVMVEVVGVVVLVAAVRWALGPLVLGGLFVNLLKPLTRLFTARVEHAQLTWGGTEAVPIVVPPLLVAVIEGGSPRQVMRRLGLAHPTRAILGPVASLAPLLGVVWLRAAPLNRAVPSWASAPHMAAALL